MSVTCSTLLEGLSIVTSYDVPLVVHERLASKTVPQMCSLTSGLKLRHSRCRGTIDIPALPKYKDRYIDYMYIPLKAS